jgi:hypothetical protein
VENFKEFVNRSNAERRPARHPRAPEKADAIGVTNADGLETASVFFLAGTAPEERDARMKAFQRKLDDFQDRDMVVVALAVGVPDEA